VWSLLEALRALAGWDLVDEGAASALAVVVARAPGSSVELTSGLRLLVASREVGAEALCLANRVLGVVDPRAEAVRAAEDLLSHLERCSLHHGRPLDLAVGPSRVARRGPGGERVEVCRWRVLPDELVGLLVGRGGGRLELLGERPLFVEGRRVLASRWPWPKLAASLGAVVEGEGHAVEA
jgi:hypothetical protein